AHRACTREGVQHQPRARKAYPDTPRVLSFTVDRAKFMDQLDNLIEDWLSYHRELERLGSRANERDAGAQHFESIDRLDEIVRVDPETGWQAIQVIFSRCENDFQRACLAAGLLEDLLVKHGRQFVDRVERAARNDSGFRELLTGVWRNT